MEIIDDKRFCTVQNKKQDSATLGNSLKETLCKTL